MVTTFTKPKGLSGLDADERRAQFLAGGGGSGLPTGGTINQVLVKNSATDGDASWKSNNGAVIGYASTTSSQGSVVAHVYVTGLTLTFTADASRVYLVTTQVYMFSTVAGDVANIALWQGAGQVQSSQCVMGAANQDEKLTIVFYVTGISGSQTFKLRAARASGTGTFTVDASSFAPNFLLIQDVTSIGPTGATGPTGANGTNGTNGTSAVAASTTVDLGYPATTSKKINVVDAAVSATSKMIVSYGPMVDTDVNTCDMDSIEFQATPKAGSYDLTVSSPTPIGGVVKYFYLLT